MATKLIGRERTLAKLRAIPAKVRPAVRKAIETGADEIVAMQQRLVPVDSGALRASIRVEMGGVALASSGVLSGGGGRRGRGSRSGGAAGGVIAGDPDLTATIVAGNAEAYYARFVEFGTAPHTIKPKNTQGALYIPGRGWLKPGEGIDHPGSSARPFFFGPFRALRRKVRSRVSRAIRKAAIEAARS